MCDYAKYTKRTCLYSDRGKVKDRRGDDPNHCLLFEKGERPKGSGFNGEPKKKGK